jgi:hypothetical protein
VSEKKEKTRIEILREESAARQSLRAKKREAAEEARLELESKFERELGPMGEKFEIIDLTNLGKGLVVIKQGSSVIHKRFENSKKEDEDIEAYVMPCLAYPSADDFRAILNDLPEVLGRCAFACHRLFGAKTREDEGKF